MFCNPDIMQAFLLLSSILASKNESSRIKIKQGNRTCRKDFVLGEMINKVGVGVNFKYKISKNIVIRMKLYCEHQKLIRT